MGLLDIIKGGLGGAATGFSLGGPIGGLIGAGAGGLMGGFGSDANSDYQKQLADYQKQLLARGVPQISTPAVAGASGFRGDQTDLISRLKALSSGQGPSLASQQLSEAMDKNQNQQQSLAQGGRGNATLGAITAANNTQNFNQQAAQQAAAARIAEQQMALQQLGSAVNQGRTADDQMSQFNAQQQNFANQSNLDAKLRALGLQDSSMLGLLQQQGGVASRPTLSDQLMAGGAGALGTYAANRGRAPSPQSGQYPGPDGLMRP
jgi:hypothetical protein